MGAMSVRVGPPQPIDLPDVPGDDQAAPGVAGAIGAPATGILLQAAGGARVVHGTDPGDFYCEHAFYVAGREAHRPGTSIRRNAEGEPLVGFLHVPADAWTAQAGGGYSQAVRHGATREVVGAALRGYVEDAARAPGAGAGPVRILLTGYTRFRSVADNPTGDFVSHAENVDAAMRAGFGADLLTLEGRPVPPARGAPPGMTLAYDVRDPATGRPRTVLVHAQPLAVSDATLDPGRRESLQSAIRGFRPNAVLSMGVTGGTEYRAEHHADNGGLRARGRGFRHDDGAAPSHANPDNYSLARALQRGRGQG